MQTHNTLKARILSFALAVAMVCTMLPATVFAAEGDTTAPAVNAAREIQSFEKLADRFTPSTGEGAPSHVYGLSVKLGTPAADLQLPTELVAMVAKTAAAAPEAVAPVSEETAVNAAEAQQPAAPADASSAPADASSTPAAPPAQSTPAAATVEQETIPVTWNSDKAYTPDENSKVIYTAVLPGGLYPCARRAAAANLCDGRQAGTRCCPECRK